MSALTWDRTGERIYETGVDHGVLYPYDANASAYNTGVAWNGLTQVSEKPSGAEAEKKFADNIKYLELRSAEDFAATVEAYTYPDEFAVLDGSANLAAGVIVRQQRRGLFGMAYRTKIGNDVLGEDYGYKLHLIYGATAAPSERSYETVNDSPDAITFSWEVTTTPVAVTGFRPTATVEIDSSKANPVNLAALERILYGEDAHGVIPATYKVTTDEEPVSGKTYYTKSGDVYTEFTGSTFVSGTTYYEMVTPEIPASAGTTPRLPLPDEVKTIMTAA